MANLILLRRDTSANWADTNPILSRGEPGFETDTNRLKIGNGNTNWVNLPYIGDYGLPSNAAGYLINDGNGTLSWAELNVFDGNYNNLTNKPVIPTDVNQLTDNDSLLTPAFIKDLENSITDLLPFDFGTIITRSVKNRLEWLLYTYDIDNGTINSPANVDHDAGTLI